MTTPEQASAQNEVIGYLLESFHEDTIGDTPIWRSVNHPSAPDMIMVDFGVGNDKFVARVRLTVEVVHVQTTKEFLANERLEHL